MHGNCLAAQTAPWDKKIAGPDVLLVRTGEFFCFLVKG